ncbi:MAG: HAMP domain-containing histidine kinase [Alkalinema sp. RL_2_19]|nr:HAMP domain-containing histidine kinase [Alkalinema sp. RL_2_19]
MARAKGWFWEARTRILLGYVGLLVGLLLIGVPLMRYQVIAGVDVRVREDIEEEVEAFRKIRAGEIDDIDRANIDFLQEDDSRAKFTPQPQTEEELQTLLEVFLRRRIPEDDTFLIAVVGSGFYKSSPRALPEALRPKQPLFEKLKDINQETFATLPSNQPEIGSFIYKVEPIRQGNQVIGRLLIVHATQGERHEAFDALQEVIQVLSGLVLLALLLGWWLSGRVLAPLRSLTLTAQQVSDSDLSRRIPVQGQGEIAALTTTFNNMLTRLDAAFQTQRNLLNDAGHELRTPITIIRGHLELMADDDPVEVSETRDLLIDELDRMSRLVDELILLARREQPNFLHPDHIDLPALIDEVFVKVVPLAERNWQLEGKPPAQLWGDRQRLTEAILNLVENAVRHTKSSDTIAIGCDRVGPQVQIWVRDTGSGIAPADQERIFERFFRSTQQPRAEGAGLGLAIVQAIVQAHGGTVAVSSELSRGSTFTLRLPINPLTETKSTATP